MEDMIKSMNIETNRYTLKKHADENGVTCICCQTADTILTHSIITSAVKNKKIEDVLQCLVEIFKWGYDYTEYLCECLDKCKSLDCICTTAVAIYLLKKANEHIDKPANLHIVEIIYKCSTSESSEFTKNAEILHNDPIFVKWIGREFCYHQILGLVDKENKLTLFDVSDGDIYSCQEYTDDKEHSILGIRVISDIDEENDYCYWDGRLKLNYNSWHKLPLLINSNCQNSSEDIKIYISGVAMHLSNPEAGLGVGRAIRKSIPNSNIISLDFEGCLGALDPCFSSSHTIISNSSQSQFEEVINILSIELNSYYIPCRDKDIDIFSKGKYLLLGNTNEAREDEDGQINIDFIKPKKCLEELVQIGNRILCPLACSIAKLEKPRFEVLNEYTMPFQIPDFFEITPSTSLFDVRHFTDSIGFPLLVKGKRRGAVVCNNLSDVLNTFAIYPWSRHNTFIQKYSTGVEKCIAYSAVDGQLTGALLMTKHKYSNEGKVKVGDIVDLKTNDPFHQFLRDLVQNEKWTGGGEIEFIEDLSGEMYLIDWNCRFPAWIFASSYTNLNLPAEFILHYLHKTSYKPPIQDSNTIVEFVRSCIEVPCNNIVTQREIHFNKISHGRTDSNKTAKTSNFDNQSQDGVMNIMNGDNKSSSAATLQHENQLSKLCEYLENIDSELVTPKRLLYLPLIADSLQRNEMLITTIAKSVSPSFEISMFLSVKTQPHLDVLLCAMQNGYLCECISISEALQALKAGFSSKQISLTGPAKFWSKEKIPSELIQNMIHFHSIFADSTSDLIDIFDRINRSELDAGMIGIRWCPAISSSTILSRFGLNCNNPETVKTVISILKERLPEEKKIGFHFHHAASNIGLQNWFAQSKSFVRFCYDFGNMVGRQVECIDFGGGFSPYSLFEEPFKLTQLFQMIHMTFGDSLPRVQFQLGKAISETAGVVITRIVQIRETNDEHKNRAIIVDTSIADISSPHFHPIYWMNRQMKWQLLKAGSDVCWGRTCMEFDRILTGIELPSGALLGDLLMITSCGAYDFTNSYEFGDGESRNISIIR